MHFLTNFSKSTILGLTFGVLLAFGVAVSAFQSPTQAPPGGNVPAPLNVGPATQTKQGGLIVSGGLDSPRVGTQQLCVGPVGAQVCKTTWPAGLAPTDVVAMGVMRRSYSAIPCCGSPGYWVNNMGADLQEYDPRAVMSISSSAATCPGPSGCTQQYTNNWYFSCSSGFRIGSTSVLDAAANWCNTLGPFPHSGCVGGACFP